MTTVTGRTERIAAWALAGAVVLLVAAGLAFLPVSLPEESIPARLLAVALAATGAVAVRRREGRVIGWLLVVSGVSTAVLDVAYSYAEVWAEAPDDWSWGPWASLLADLMGQVSVVPLFILLPLLFPTGRLASPRWRWVLWASVVLTAASLLSILFGPTAYDNRAHVVVGSNPLGTGDPTVMEAAAVVSGLGLVSLAAAAVVSFVLRFRRSTGIERLQMRWLAAGFVAAATVVLSMGAIAGLDALSGGRLGVPELVFDLAMGTAVLFIPFGVGLAVTRHRLYDIGTIVSRTVTYGVVVAVLVGTYAGAVVGLGAVAGAVTGRSGDLVVALSTLLVAALFQPLRGRVQAGVDRRFNRTRYDHGKALDRFSLRTRDEVDGEQISADLRRVVAESLQPHAVSLWTDGGAVRGRA